jgi:hypothetical protein
MATPAITSGASWGSSVRTLIEWGPIAVIWALFLWSLLEHVVRRFQGRR